MGIAVRFCACALAFVLLAGGIAKAASAPPTPLPRPFGRGYAYEHPTAFAPYTFESTLVRLHFDFSRGMVYGDEIAIVRPKRGSLRSLPFNTLDIHYDGITVDGRPALYSFDTSNQLVNVRLHSPAPVGARLVVEFKYRTHPQRGIYFVRPDKSYADVTPEIWSQGETTDNRRWFPTWDEPNQKTPSELIVTVPRGWTVVANGYPKSHAVASATETWDWNAPRPKSTYLIAFAAGPLSKLHTTLGQAKDGDVARYGNGSLDVDSFVQPPKASLAARCFGRTNDMVAYFQQIIGVKFPWEKYDQTTAERFIYGGMEDTSATILTDSALHPATEDLENSCDVLVSHELAQQWWGDDVTMSDWSNGWINEGFATYYHQLWGEKDLGEASFEYDRYQAQQTYFDETRRYYRPIVDYVYTDGLELFDASGHERPAQALHMLRHMFGDRRFYAALRAYYLEFQEKNVDTRQFFASIGESLGTDLTWFENEWFYRAAYPHYDVVDRYDAAAKTLTLDVRQENRDGKPFRMPVEIEAVVDGESHVVRPTIERNQQVVTMTGLASKPQMVLFDPNDEILRQLTFEKPVEDLAYQLANAPHVGDREWALSQLADLTAALGATRAAAQHAVAEAALSDAFYGVRADAVAGTIDAALGDKDTRVRLAAEEAAGGIEGQPVLLVRDLSTMSDDPDPDVAAAALASLGALKATGIYEKLVAVLDQPSLDTKIAVGALRGLAAYGDVRALSLVEARTAYGTPEEERNAAVVALARLAARAKTPRVALEALLGLVSRDPLIRTRIAAASALGILGDASALPVLHRVERTDSQLIVQIAAWNAIQTIEDAVAMRAYEGLDQAP
jgi:aminopeptidase N